jgi:aldose 1-epimerase
MKKDSMIENAISGGSINYPAGWFFTGQNIWITGGNYMPIAHAEQVIVEGFTFIRLYCADGEGETEALISPAIGANLCRVTHNGLKVIDFDPGRLSQRDHTGCFLMYPFPGRMKDNRYTVNGQTYSHPYNISPKAYMHGVVRDAVFRVSLLESGRGQAVLTCFADFAHGSRLYELFPFENRFSVTYTLSPGRIRLTFTVEAKEPTPFGLAAHPYFTRLGGDGGVSVQVPAATRVLLGPDKLATGETVPAEGPYDLRQGRTLSGPPLDEVYTGREPGKKAVLRYAGIPFRTELDAGPSFSHFVVFTPPGESYFCVENQTCPPDAFNLHARGLRAHLLVADGVFTDWIEYAFVPEG